MPDGGLGDGDGVANGLIVDPVIPVRAMKPSPPRSVTVLGGDHGAGVLFMPPAKNGGASILGRTAKCTSSNGGVQGSMTGKTSPITVVGLTNGKSYTCAVTARNLAGSSGASGVSAAFTPKPKATQTITFGSLPGRTLAESPVTVTAAASSGSHRSP